MQHTILSVRYNLLTIYAITQITQYYATLHQRVALNDTVHDYYDNTFAITVRALL